MHIGWKALDWLASATPVTSFGAPGFAIRRHSFADPDLRVDLSGKTVVVTGASRGLGKSVAEILAARGARLVLVARDAAKLDELAHGLEHGDHVRGEPARAVALPADLSSLDAVRGLAERIAREAPKVDVLVHNAGFLPLERTTTVDGLDAAFATNVLSGFLLTSLLAPNLAAAGRARVVHVTSGGMYLTKLDLDVLEGRVAEYDGVVAYAQTKRAQVILSEMWAEELAPIGATSNTVHPGWAETEGVEKSLPRFHKVMRSVLRTSAEGADTIAWLAASPEVEGVTGKLFFDREARRTHVVPWTRSSPAERRALFDRCAELTSVDVRSGD